jgi:hypothetical protein
MSVGWTKTKKPFLIQPKARKKIKGIVNYFTQKPIILNEGEVLCNRCHGEGLIMKFNIKLKTTKEMWTCKKCAGDGKLSWLDNMMGGVR